MRTQGENAVFGRVDEQRDAVPVDGRKMYPRVRLVGALEQARNRAVVITGGPGAGKTSLAFDYARHHRRPCLRHACEPQDGMPSVLFRRLAARAGMPLDEAAVEAAAASLSALARFAHDFFSDLMRSDACQVLVLDDCEKLTPTLAIQTVLLAAGQAVPESGRLLLLSRHEKPQALAPLAESGLVSAIGHGDLRLDAGEVQGIAALHGHALHAGRAEQLQRLLGGWVAGLQMLLMHDPDAALDTVTADRVPEPLFRYLHDEVFAPLPLAAQRLLLRCALLSRFDARTVCAITRDERPAKLLPGLAQQSAFVERTRSAPVGTACIRCSADCCCARRRSATAPPI